MPTSVYCTILFGLFITIQGAVLHEGCNLLHCFQIFDSLFVSDENTSCFKSSKLLKCASQCTENPSENFIIKGLESLHKNLCSEFYSEDSASADKCIFRQRFSILSCVYSYSTLEAEDPHIDSRLLTCKKSLNVGACSSLSVPCKEWAALASRDLLSSLFNSFLDECHTFDTMDIAYIEVKPLNTKDYILLGNCLDENSNYISKCLSKLNNQNESCRSMNSFMNCMQILVHNKCSDYEDIFTKISQVFLSKINIFFSCNKSSELISKKGSETTNESAKNFPHDEEVIQKTSLISSTSPNSITTKSSLYKISHSKDIFSTSDPITNNNQNPNFKQFSDENETILNPSNTQSTDKSSKQQVYENSDNLVSNPPSNAAPNSSTPIVIHKTTYITLTYRAKSEGSNVSSVIMLIGTIFVCLFLHSKLL